MATKQELKLGLGQKELLEIFDYDPETGICLWRSDRYAGGGRKMIDAGTEVGTTTVKGYREVSLNYCKIFVHRLGWMLTYGEWPEHMLDHRDMDRLNNRISNLRPSTGSQNRANTKVRAKSGFKGVTTHKHASGFTAQITVGGKNKYLGRYKTAEAAHAAYQQAAALAFGEFARME